MFTNLFTIVFLQKGKKMEVAKVIAPYQAASAEQLTLERGQLVQIRKKSSSGWWEGEVQVCQKFSLNTWCWTVKLWIR
jgi:hypothetical protein